MSKDDLLFIVLVFCSVFLGLAFLWAITLGA